VFGPDVEDEYIWIQTLPMHSKGDVVGVKTLCKEVGIAGEGNPTARLLKQRLYAYSKSGGGDAGRLAASAVSASETDTLPPLPQNGASGCNTNMKALVDWLFRAMPPYLLLLRSTRIRTKDLPATIASRMQLNGCERCTGHFTTCRCMSRHPWLVAVKGLLVSVFMRKQQNYQRALILFLTFMWCAIGHASNEFVELLLAMVEASLALSKRGDSNRCLPADLKQEEVVGQCKRSAERWPASFGMASLRTRIYSYYEFLREAIGAVKHDPSKPTQSKEKIRVEARDVLRMRGVAVAVQDLILASNGITTLAGNASLALNNVQRIFYLPSLAKVNMAAAVRVMVQGLRAQVAVALPATCVAAASTMHTVARKKGREETASDKLHNKRSHDLLVKTMSARGEFDLPDKATMFNSGQCGNSKAAAGIGLLARYGKVLADANGRYPFHVFKTTGDRSTYIQGIGLKRIKAIDALQFLQSRPQMWKEGVQDDLAGLARSILVKFCSTLYFEDGVVAAFWCFDCNMHITHLRVIQHLKRGKVQAAKSIQEAIHGRRGGSTKVSELGGFQAVMKSKDAGFPRLVAELAYQARNPDVGDGWDIRDHLKKGTALCIVGAGSLPSVSGASGSLASKSNAVVVFGRDTNSISLTPHAGVGHTAIYTSDALQEVLKDIEQQGEGEAMIFLIARHILVHVGKDDPIAASALSFELVCHDVDALAGRAMPEIARLTHECALLGLDVSGLKLHLAIHDKSDALLKKLGVLVDAQEGGARRVVNTDGITHT
jgi:hypothetical protein